MMRLPLAGRGASQPTLSAFLTLRIPAPSESGASEASFALTNGWSWSVPTMATRQDTLYVRTAMRLTQQFHGTPASDGSCPFIAS
jgi:hypothetical protein